MKRFLVCLLVCVLLVSSLFFTSCDEFFEEDGTEVVEIELTKSASELKGKNYKEVQEYFKTLGFTTITLIEGDGKESEVGEVYRIVIEEFLDSDDDFVSGDKYDSDDEIKIYYVGVKEPVKPNITIDNNVDFAALMQITNQTDVSVIEEFVDKYDEEIIEFDGCVALMMQAESYKTRYNVCIAGGDYDANRLYGPLFAFENVNFSEMKVTGSDVVEAGMDFRITAQIKGFSEEGTYIILKPVSMVLR